MQIEKLPPDRWREYKEIRLEALRTDPDAFGANYQATVERPDSWWIGHLETAQADPNRTILFAIEGENAIGIAGSYPEQDPARVDITSMFVKPGYRGKGIGRALLQAVVKEVTAPEVRLCVNADQPSAVALYKSFGFVTLAETQLCRDDGTPYVQLYMALINPEPAS